MFFREENTHISMQMRRQTQTNMLVSWIATYHTEPDAQIIPTSEQICPSLYSSLFCLVCCPVCLCREYYSVPAVTPPILSDSGQLAAQTELNCCGDLERCVLIRIKQD